MSHLFIREVNLLMGLGLTKKAFLVSPKLGRKALLDERAGYHTEDDASILFDAVDDRVLLVRGCSRIRAASNLHESAAADSEKCGVDGEAFYGSHYPIFVFVGRRSVI